MICLYTSVCVCVSVFRNKVKDHSMLGQVQSGEPKCVLRAVGTGKLRPRIWEEELPGIVREDPAHPPKSIVTQASWNL